MLYCMNVHFATRSHRFHRLRSPWDVTMKKKWINKKHTARTKYRRFSSGDGVYSTCTINKKKKRGSSDTSDPYTHNVHIIMIYVDFKSKRVYDPYINRRARLLFGRDYIPRRVIWDNIMCARTSYTYTGDTTEPAEFFLVRTHHITGLDEYLWVIIIIIIIATVRCGSIFKCVVFSLIFFNVRSQRTSSQRTENKKH